MTRSITVLGSTGSIGVQTLDVARMHHIKVVALTANQRIDILEKQAREFQPALVAVRDAQAAAQLKIALADTDITVLSGEEGILTAARYETADTVVNAIVGVAGLLPTLEAVRAGKQLALANKETLVAGGVVVKEAIRQHGVKLYPVDSEHSAIFQCLQGCPEGALKKVILTASGGAFYGKTRQELANVTVQQALKHPNWSMGAKITIDSATLMNKGLEVIEASWLFDVPDEKIDVLIHRESIVHSLVEFTDNSVIAQLGLPDMRIPIQYAITYPNREPSPVAELNLAQIGNLSFFEPDYETFKCLNACKAALKMGGAATAIANGANEEANMLFRNGKIKFLDIGELVEGAVKNVKNFVPQSVDEVIKADSLARQYVKDIVGKTR